MTCFVHAIPCNSELGRRQKEVSKLTGCLCQSICEAAYQSTTCGHLCAEAIPRLPDFHIEGNRSPLPHSARDEAKRQPGLPNRGRQEVWLTWLRWYQFLSLSRANGLN